MPSCCRKTNPLKTIFLLWLSLAIIFVFSSCQSPEKKYAVRDAEALSENADNAFLEEEVSQIELQMIGMGLVDVQSIDTSICIDIKYATTDNFLKTAIYGDFNKAYLQADVAEKLKNAQAYLAELHPGYSLVVYDAARPVVFQQMIWDSLKMPVREKGKYASNPRNGSLHNYGAAVDLSIIDEQGNELDMGCPFDYFGPLAYPVMENQLLSEGKLTQLQVDNRKLLRQVMYKTGFFNIQTEWWHFNSCTRDEAKRKYKRIE